MNIVYSSFDRFPAPKGAAVHIRQFATALGAMIGRVDLVTVAPAPDESPPDYRSSSPPFEIAHRVFHHPLPAKGADMIQRVLHFRKHLHGFWREHRADVAHFRSIFEGYPLLELKSAKGLKLIYEVNGLPSIELKYHYPGVADDRELLRKLVAQEHACLRAADRIVTVSTVNADHLLGRGVPHRKISVIPNGVDLDAFRFSPPRTRGIRPFSLLYAGTMTSWQGVYHAIEALALLRRDLPATLTLIGPARPIQKKQIREQAYKFGVLGHVSFLPPARQQHLASLMHAHDAVLAPLLPNDRNLVQGCCPLKVLEGMASGTPVIASDLPVVRELATTASEALLVRPGSAKAIKDAALRLAGNHALATALSKAARVRVENQFSWSDAKEALAGVYRTLFT